MTGVPQAEAKQRPFTTFLSVQNDAYVVGNGCWGFIQQLSDCRKIVGKFYFVSDFSDIL
jgi:hypothetical protein